MTRRDGTRKPTLSGSLVTLRPFVAEDADAMTCPSAADERLVSGRRSAR